MLPSNLKLYLSPFLSLSLKRGNLWTLAIIVLLGNKLSLSPCLYLSIKKGDLWTLLMIVRFVNKLSLSPCPYLSLRRGNLWTLRMIIKLGNKLSPPRWCGYHLKSLRSQLRRLPVYLSRLLYSLLQDLVPSLFQEIRLHNSQ